jgi:hypothetical protein
VWDILTAVVKGSGGLGLAALLIMVVFLALSIILLVYYVGRLVTLYIGAVLAPIILLLWLVPGFRDFAESAAKTYLITIFVLFVHVVILQLAASLFAGIAVTSPLHTPDTLMSLVVGLATIIALLKTQGVMTQFSYVSIGPRTARKLGANFLNGISYLSYKGAAATELINPYRGDSFKAVNTRVRYSRMPDLEKTTSRNTATQQTSDHKDPAKPLASTVIKPSPRPKDSKKT